MNHNGDNAMPPASFYLTRPMSRVMSRALSRARTKAQARRASALTVATLAVTGALLGGCSGGPSLGQIRSKANVALDRGDYEEAARQYEAYAERRPGDAEARYNQGRAYLGMGDAYRAREAFELAADLEPANLGYRQALVDSLVTVGDADGVFDVLERDETNIYKVDAAIERGDAALDLGLVDEAERAYKLAARWAAVDDPRPHRSLAAMYRDLGDRRREIDRLRVLLYIDPQNEDVRARLRELGEIPGPSLELNPNEL